VFRVEVKGTNSKLNLHGEQKVIFKQNLKGKKEEPFLVTENQSRPRKQDQV
jgi:hypothetical protein